jgi:hypothetical protein
MSVFSNDVVSETLAQDTSVQALTKPSDTQLVDGSAHTQPVSGTVTAKIEDTAGNAISTTGTSLNVNITGGSTSGAVPDKTAFTYGTTNETPVGGVFQDTSPTLSSGTTGALRLTSARGLHSNLRDNSGTELATASNPVRTDPTGTTTQPVSGTVTANAGTGNFTVVQPTGSNLHVQVDAGSAVIGHVVTDTGSTTAVTGNVTVVQPTGTNLHTVVDSGTISTNPVSSSTSTVSRISTSTTPATALASNASRKQAIIYSEAGVHYILLGAGTVSATNYTVNLSANSYYEVPSMWTGIITVVKSTGTGNIQATELV